MPLLPGLLLKRKNENMYNLERAGVAGVVLATNLNLFISAIILPVQVYKISNQKARGIWCQ
jgi:hypothetical protein